MIQVIGIPRASDATPFSANLFLAYKEADVRLERSMFEKSINPFGLLMTCYR